MYKKYIFTFPAYEEGLSKVKGGLKNSNGQFHQDRIRPNPILLHAKVYDIASAGYVMYKCTFNKKIGRCFSIFHFLCPL